MPGSWPGSGRLRKPMNTAFWEPSAPRHPRARESQAGSILGFLCFALDSAGRYVRSLSFLNQQHVWKKQLPVIINYHKPITSENISQDCSIRPCHLQPTAEQTWSDQNSPGSASGGFVFVPLQSWSLNQGHRKLATLWERLWTPPRKQVSELL